MDGPLPRCGVLPKLAQLHLTVLIGGTDSGVQCDSHSRFSVRDIRTFLKRNVCATFGIGGSSNAAMRPKQMSGLEVVPRAAGPRSPTPRMGEGGVRAYG